MIECTCQERPLYVFEDWSAVLALVQTAKNTQTHTGTGTQQRESFVEKRKPAPVIE